MDITQTMRKHITTEQLKDYLVSKCWTERIVKRKEIRQFAGFGYAVVIPAYVNLVDYDRVVEIAIDCIAAVEDREVDEVLSDILPSALVELIELRELISDCERLIAKYDYDFALKQLLESLKAREQNLVAEIV